MSAGIVKASNSKEVFERQARLCKAFAHPARLQILDLLGSGEQGVSHIAGDAGNFKNTHLSAPDDIEVGRRSRNSSQRQAGALLAGDS